MARSIKSYYEEEYNALLSRFHNLADWGYTEELEPLVLVLLNAVNEIKEKMSNL